jgi:hypothetical protein
MRRSMPATRSQPFPCPPRVPPPLHPPAARHPAAGRRRPKKRCRGDVIPHHRSDPWWRHAGHPHWGWGHRAHDASQRGERRAHGCGPELSRPSSITHTFLFPVLSPSPRRCVAEPSKLTLLAAKPLHADEEARPLKVVFGYPAKYFIDTSPIGNGRLGAMIWGCVESERLQCNRKPPLSLLPCSSSLLNHNFFFSKGHCWTITFRDVFFSFYLLRSSPVLIYDDVLFISFYARRRDEAPKEEGCTLLQGTCSFLTLFSNTQEGESACAITGVVKKGTYVWYLCQLS